MVTRNYPKLSYINAITNEKEAVITFTENHDFTVGEIVSFRVTKNFGMHQLNQKRGKVISKTNDTITVDIDTSTWDPFSYALINTEDTTPPICVPSASGVIDNLYTPSYNIEDAFDRRNF